MEKKLAKKEKEQNAEALTKITALKEILKLDPNAAVPEIVTHRGEWYQSIGQTEWVNQSMSQSISHSIIQWVNHPVLVTIIYFGKIGTLKDIVKLDLSCAKNKFSKRWVIWVGQSVGQINRDLT